jgi:hypothetical protein
MLSSRCDVHVEPDVRIIIWDVIQGMIRADKFGVDPFYQKHRHDLTG